MGLVGKFEQDGVPWVDTLGSGAAALDGYDDAAIGRMGRERVQILRNCRRQDCFGILQGLQSRYSHLTAIRGRTEEGELYVQDYGGGWRMQGVTESDLSANVAQLALTFERTGPDVFFHGLPEGWRCVYEGKGCRILDAQSRVFRAIEPGPEMTGAPIERTSGLQITAKVWSAQAFGLTVNYAVAWLTLNDCLKWGAYVATWQDWTEFLRDYKAGAWWRNNGTDWEVWWYNTPMLQRN